MLDSHVLSELSVDFLDMTLDDVASDLALDEALLVAAEEHGAGAILRVWERPELAVVLGASGRLHEDVDVERCRAEGVAIARRSSGGGTVVIGPGALNFTVVLPSSLPGFGAVDTAQAAVLGHVAEALRAVVPGVEVRGSGDLTLGDRKLAGSAQRRLRHHFLVHASILYDFPLAPIIRLTRLPTRQPEYRAGRDHAAFLTNLPLSRLELVARLRQAWCGADPVPSRRGIPERLVRDLVETRFGRSDWVERL